MRTAGPPPGRWDDRAYHFLRQWRDRLFHPFAVVLSRLPLPAWLVSLAGVAAAASTLWTAPREPRLALVGFALALLADALDGAVARWRGTESPSGKWVDHACDAATFTLLVVAAVLAGFVAVPLAVFAAFAATAVVAAALAAARRRDPLGFRRQPRAGFIAHLPKLPFYVAFPGALLGGAGVVPPALWATTGLALVPLVWLVPAGRAGRLQNLPERTTRTSDSKAIIP